MIEYRNTISDDEARQLAAFAVGGMQVHRYPLHVCTPKVAAVIELVRRGPPHFGMVAVAEGRIVGAIAALVSEMLFFERWEAHVVMCRAVVPGVGRRLIAALRDWAAADLRVRRVTFPQEDGADPRIGKLLARYGFTRPQVNSIFYKEA